VVRHPVDAVGSHPDRKHESPVFPTGWARSGTADDDQPAQSAWSTLFAFLPDLMVYVSELNPKRARFRWGYHVIVADMRDFGETARLSPKPTSATMREGHDVVALAR
jgi:hypothetical protein